ncbi:hypothetical protein D3C71_2211040 [compost metagenome]
MRLIAILPLFAGKKSIFDVHDVDENKDEKKNQGNQASYQDENGMVTLHHYAVHNLAWLVTQSHNSPQSIT